VRCRSAPPTRCYSRTLRRYLRTDRCLSFATTPPTPRCSRYAVAACRDMMPQTLPRPLLHPPSSRDALYVATYDTLPRAVPPSTSASLAAAERLKDAREMQPYGRGRDREKCSSKRRPPASRMLRWRARTRTQQEYYAQRVQLRAACQGANIFAMLFARYATAVFQKTRAAYARTRCR